MAAYRQLPQVDRDYYKVDPQLLPFLASKSTNNLDTLGGYLPATHIVPLERRLIDLEVKLDVLAEKSKQSDHMRELSPAVIDMSNTCATVQHFRGRLEAVEASCRTVDAPCSDFCRSVFYLVITAAIIFTIIITNL